VGHVGTLDPFATGLLLVLSGRATRLSQYLIGLRKKYEGTMRLGVSTATHDLTGEVTAESECWRELESEVVESAADALVGRQRQRPPRFSAKKVAGQRAYRLARKGESVDLEPREIEVFDFSVRALKGPDLDFSCDVSSGTYIRALARDLGETLGCGAHLKSLRRTSVGDFTIEDAQTLSAIEDGDFELGSPAEAVGHLPRLSIESEEMRKMIRHGRPVPTQGRSEGIVAMLAGRRLLAIAERSDDLFKPKVVMEG
jgi:tRNA pseudouridine55 synthase